MDKIPFRHNQKEMTHSNSFRQKISNVFTVWMFILLCQLVFFMHGYFYDMNRYFWRTFAVIAILISVISLYLTSPNKRIITMIKLIAILILVKLISIILTPNISYVTKEKISLVCQYNLSHLHNMALGYAEDHDGMMPSGPNWYSLITEKSGTVHNCPANAQEASENDITFLSYAMNSEATGEKMENLPDDLVLFFEAAVKPQDLDAWMQNNEHHVFQVYNDSQEEKHIALYGGPELITYRHRMLKSLFNCILVNGHVETTQHPLELRWYIDPERTIDKNLAKQIDQDYHKQRRIVLTQKAKELKGLLMILSLPYIVWGLLVLAQMMSPKKKSKPTC